ncbi:MAG: phosphatase PAP2 family protein [Crocinitomix sp.]|nr:phosphatase PAP2 family protein [Crocinitomix sp.]
MKINKFCIPLLTLLFLTACGAGSENSDDSENTRTDSLITEAEATGENNVAYIWGAAALQGTAMDTERFKPRPTVTSRYLGLICTSMFDAWSRYDETAIPLIATGIERAAEAEQTITNKEIAISYAAYGTLCEYYYSDSVYFASIMGDLGYDINNHSMDQTTPEGVGNSVAKAIIETRMNDGSNQYATHAGSDGIQYFDYTNYQPVNNADNNTDINRWQPKYFDDGKGGRYAPGCLTPYWQLVQPLALDSAAQFRPGPPPLVGSDQLAQELVEVISIQDGMTDYDKGLVEFMRDGPQSVQQAGHWLKFAQHISRRDKHTLDDDVKMYFLVEMTAMDGFIASWDAKMHYDYARPFQLVHEYYTGKIITGWKGEGQGFGEIDGKDWRPYSPAIFLCPPFPSYVSGHSTISGGCAEALRLFTGSEEFGAEATILAGELTETDPEFYGDSIVLKFPTFTEAAEMAGQSRVMGGYHIQADNVAGLQLGRDVAHKAWEVYQKHLGK